MEANKQQSTQSSTGAYRPEAVRRPSPHIDDYYSNNSTSNALEVISLVYIALSVLAAVGGYMVATIFVNNFLFKLLGAAIGASLFLVPGLLLKAIAEILQNSQDSSNGLLYLLNKKEEEAED